MASRVPKISATSFVADFSEQMQDPVSFEPLTNAVTLPCGHNLNQDTADRVNGICPLDMMRFTSYTPNYAIRDLVNRAQSVPVPPSSEAIAHFERGKALYFASQFEEAVPALMAALSLSPGYEKAQAFLESSLKAQESAPSAPGVSAASAAAAAPARLPPDALTQACRTKDPTKVREALSRGARPDAHTLTWACDSQNLEIVESAINANAEPDADTLTAACVTKQFGIVAQVLALGAKPDSLTLDIARQSGNQRIMSAVQRAMGTGPSPAAPVVANPAVSAKDVKPLPAWVFGVAEWKKYIGDPGVEPPLPPDINARLAGLSADNVLVLVPETVNGRPLDLEYLGELVQKPLQGHATKYRYFDLGGYVDPPAPKSHWALLTRTVIDGSRNKPYKDGQAILNNYNQKANIPYQVPTILDAAVCLFMEYVRTGIWLYGRSPYTLTFCQEKYDAKQRLLIGGGSVDGLDVDNGCAVSEGIGVGGLRKSVELGAGLFKPLPYPSAAAAAASPAVVGPIDKVAQVKVAAKTLPAWVFGAAEWKRYIGDPGVEPTLPPDIIARLAELSANNVLVLIPETVNGRPLDLEYLGELVQKPLRGHATNYGSLHLGNYIDRPVHKSHWALLTRTLIKGSRNKPYKDEQAVLDSYCRKANISYQVPTVLDVTTCLFMEYVRTGTWLYGDSPPTATWCQEKHDAEYQLTVGGWSSGLLVNANNGAHEFHGVGGLSKIWAFSPCETPVDLSSYESF